MRRSKGLCTVIVSLTKDEVLKGLCTMTISVSTWTKDETEKKDFAL